MRKNAKKILSMVWITLGALMASFSVAALLLPNDAIDYGTAGIAIIISKLTGFNLSICVACVVTPFLILGFIRMGLDFIVRAGWGSLVYTLGLSWFEE
ncbi:MAG: YitT family protein, partial [Lachnospiraceae bacterium]|nr:YitT family protein [Lachnospiraceae bacterium]